MSNLLVSLTLSEYILSSSLCKGSTLLYTLFLTLFTRARCLVSSLKASNLITHQLS
jgi:hypothetical protein